MRLCIVRHGKAEPAACAPSDEDRCLIGRGVDQARWLAERLARGLGAELIVTSPVRRAAQTAEVLRAALGAPLEFDARLRTGASVEHALDAVRERAERSALVVVGHNPQLEELIALLLDERPRASAPFRTGEAALMEVKPSPGRVAPAVLLGRFRLDADA